jgi:hypothetical protein
MPLEEAGRWPDLLQIVRERVKPERDKLNDNADGRRRKQYWWQFGRYTPSLFSALRPLKRCLVTSVVSKHLIFSFQPTDRVFSHRLYVFTFQHSRYFALLQSRVHAVWTWLLSSTMKTDLNYSGTDCFETFPFPHELSLAALDPAGQGLDDARAQYMVASNQGLTATYNQLKDPDCDSGRMDEILHLRLLHEDLDRAVLAAYGWSDIAVPPYCPATDAERAAVALFEDTVIDRLFALNAERAAEECQAVAKPKATPTTPKKARKKIANQTTLLDEE